MSNARRNYSTRAVTGLVALTFGISTTAFAAPPCLSRATIPANTATGWAAPLNRAITVEAPDITLRAALERVASESRVRLTYSADLLPTDRRVCLSIDRISVGAVINELLRGTMLRALVLDADNVALTPSRGPTATDRTAIRTTEPNASINELDRIIVTGTVDGAKNRSSPFALDVLDSRALQRSDASTLSNAFDGAVPGLWMWPQSPASMVGRFGSVRGASSFGVTSPKVYIDGIAVSNPLVFTQFDAERIDRIEVIRGPQGAALYGADAISGVVNIITRHDGAAADQPSMVLRSRAGFSTSSFSDGDAFVQDHSIGFRTGSARRTMGLGLTGGTVGNYIPGGGARSLLADGDLRIIGSQTVLTAMARFAAKNAGALTSPVLANLVPSSPAAQTKSAGNGPWSGQLKGAPPSDSVFGSPGSHNETEREQRLRATYGNSASDLNATQSLRQYTFGTTGSWTSSPLWTHTLVAGVDGYRLNGLIADGISVPVPSDSTNRLSQSGADRTTLALRSVAHVGNEDGVATTFIMGAEHTATREQIESNDRIGGGNLSLSANAQTQALSLWSNTAGVLGQVNSSWHNTFFASAGGRAEYSSGASSSARVSLLPMLGAAFVRERDGQTLKLRAAYGKGIRPSNSVARAATWMSGRTASALGGPGSHLALASLRNLEPESQAGIEIGADVSFGSQLGFHITRFNQRATGLVQAVALPSAARVSSPQAEPGITYELQNVGAISNRGWELQATSSLGRLSLQASASFVDSRVNQVASRYGGELLPGDRMLEVPARTFGMSASYSAPRWTSSWTLSRAMDWINYDQLRIAEQQASPDFNPRTITGVYLRNYWREYNGATRLRGNFSIALTRMFSLTMSGENLLNLQRGEPDNVTVIPGRTLTAGLRTRF